MLVIAGVMFFAAAGDPGKLGRAKSLLTSVVIGLAIIYGSWLIINTFFVAMGVAKWTGLTDNPDTTNVEEGWFQYPCY